MIKRSATIYTEVESFADYELTQCIAYEMAIRNPIYKQKVDNAVLFYKEHKGSISKYLKGIDSIVDDKDLNFDLWKIGSDYKSTLENMIEDIDVIPFNYYSFELEYKHVNIFGKEIYDIIDLLQEEYEPDQNITEIEDVQIVHQKDMEETQLYRAIKRNGYSITTGIRIHDESAVLYDVDNEEYKEIKTVEDFKKLIVDEDYDEYEIDTEIIIEESFKRPKIKIDKLKSKNTKIEIDLNKPLNEILAYISHIKKDLEDNKEILKAPIQLLDAELQKADNLICDTKGKCFDARETLSKQEKLADMFYIYDCLKVGMTQRKIQHEVYNYYADKNIDNKTLDAKTLKKYKEIAIDYIDNKRYNELLTGIKLKTIGI